MWDLRLRCILVVLAVAALVPSAVFAQGADRDRDLEDLQAKLFFLRRLVAKYPVSGFAESWKYLEEDAKKGRVAYPEDRPFNVVHREVLLSWGETLEAGDRVDEALERYEAIARRHDYDKSAPGYRKATAAAAGIYSRKAEEATGDEPKLAHLEAARELFLLIGDRRSADGLTDQIVDLKCKEGLRLFDERKFADALIVFQEIQNKEGSLGSGRAADALRTIEEKTGFFRIDFIDVRPRGTEVADVGRLKLTPRGEGERREISLGDLVGEKKFRWMTGEYDVELFLPGSDRAVVTARVSLGKAGAEIRFPRRFPDGMVYVPAGGGVSRAFFIDRTEVTESAYRQIDPGYTRPSRVTGDDLPAHGITFEKAKAYASSVGKALPTAEQWYRAAFGDTPLDYPWGNGSPEGRCHVSKPGPTSVDAYPNGASPFGLLNTAGNVWEWRRDGYAIGGGFRSRGLSSPVPGAGWTADFLRDGKPGDGVYGNPKFDQRRYSKYRVSDVNLLEVGIRCVIEL